MSRDQPLKAPRYIEPRPMKTTSTGSTDVTADVIVHKVRQVETEPQMQLAVITTSQQTDAQQRIAITSNEEKQCVEQQNDPNTVPLRKPNEHSNQENKISHHLEESGADVTKSRATNTASQPTKFLTPVSGKPPEKPAKAKPKQETKSTSENTPDSKVRESTQVALVKLEVKAVQSKPHSSEPSPSLKPQLDQVQPKRATVQPSSTDKIRRDMFQVRVKSEPVKSSPVKAQSKPRRQTRATLAYDRVMFFSDFFRRLESDRRLFALPPVRRNRVYVSPRAEDASAAPVKFPRPAAMKKGRIGVVSATRNSGIRSSPFTTKRRLPIHTWDHKIDLESIEADATLITQLSENQWNGVDQQIVSLEAPRQSSERSIDPGQETAKVENSNVLRGADNAGKAESAFICTTKHSTKMRRRLKRKQRKRSVTGSEGIEGRVPDGSTSDSGEGTPSHCSDDRSKRGSKKEPRSSTECHYPTNPAIVATVIPPEPSRKTDKSTDRRLHSHASCPVLTVQQKPAISPVYDDKNVSCTLASRGKTMVEILSHIGEQVPSNQNETPTSPQPGNTTDPGEDRCTVSVVVNMTDDAAGGTVAGLDGKLQWTISHFTPSSIEDVTREEKGRSTAESWKTSRENLRPGSAASTVTRLSVTKNFGDGQSLRRSHSCAEMRRRMVLTEWEVVTNTKTEVTVTETGPPSQPVDSENKSFNDDIKIDFSSDTGVPDQNSSRNQTLGLAKNLTGHRRSKSSDSRIRGLSADAHAITNPDVAQHPHANVCLFSPNEEHHVNSRSRHETDTENVPVLSTSDKFPVHQRVESVADGSAELENPGVLSANQLSLSVDTGCETPSTQPEIPVVVTYTLNEPYLVDALRNTETGWEERWTTGSNADRIRDYTLVNVIEKIRLHTVGNEPDHRNEDHLNEIIFETIPVIDCSDVVSPEKIPEDNNGGLCEESVTQPSQAPDQDHCRSTAEENGVADQQPSTCLSEVQDDDIHDKSEVVHRGQGRQDVPTITEDMETANGNPTLEDQRTNIADNVLQSSTKEDEDSEEKEEDEAENGEAGGDETEEKGMLELSDRTVEKNGDVCEESTDTRQSVEHLDCENMTESQTVGIAADSCSHERSEPPAMTEVLRQDEVRGGGSVTDDDEVRPNDELSLNASVASGMALSGAVAEPGDQLELTMQTEGHPQTHGQQGETEQYSDTFGSSVGTSSASESQIPHTESCPLEPDRTCSNLMSSQFDPDTREGKVIEGEVSSTECDGHTKVFPAAETGQVLVESVRDDQQVIPMLNDNTAGEYLISDVEELVSENTLSIWNQDQPNDAEPVPPTLVNEHSSTEHAIQTVATSTNDAGNFGNMNSFLSTGADTSYDESFAEIEDNPMKSQSTFAHKGTLLPADMYQR